MEDKAKAWGQLGVPLGKIGWRATPSWGPHGKRRGRVSGAKVARGGKPGGAP